jgi:hypothetical protein
MLNDDERKAAEERKRDRKRREAAAQRKADSIDRRNRGLHYYGFVGRRELPRDLVEVGLLPLAEIYNEKALGVAINQALTDYLAHLRQQQLSLPTALGVVSSTKKSSA